LVGTCQSLTLRVTSRLSSHGLRHFCFHSAASMAARFGPVCGGLVLITIWTIRIPPCFLFSVQRPWSKSAEFQNKQSSGNDFRLSPDNSFSSDSLVHQSRAQFRTVEIIRNVSNSSTTSTTKCVKFSLEQGSPDSLIPLDCLKDRSTTSNSFYLVVTTEPGLRVVMPNRRQNVTNYSLLRTSRQSHENSCRWAAMNGGPFERNGSPVGLVVINGSEPAKNNLRTQDDDYIGFGLSYPQSGNNGSAESFWVFGKIRTLQEAQQFNLMDFVTGFGWLVYNGHNVAADMSASGRLESGPLRAARSAVGVDSAGRLVLFVSDGCEKWYDVLFWGEVLIPSSKLIV
jgi:uncharacterized protein YigE (DUF2233 family)